VVLAAALLLALPPAGCTFALERQRAQCETSADCQSRAVGAVCTSEGLCERVTTPAADESKATNGCERDSDCDAWSLCAEGSCRSLLANGCEPLGEPVALEAEQRLALAVLVPAAARSSIESAVESALGDLIAGFSSSSHVPALFAVACPDDDQQALSSLLSAGVEILIGPTSASVAQPISELVRQRAVLFAPRAEPPHLGSLVEQPWVVSCRPQWAEHQVLAAARFVRNQLISAELLAPEVRAVLVASQVELAQGRASFDAEALAAANIELLAYDSFEGPSAFLSALAATTPEPGLLLAPFGSEDWSHNLAALEQERSATGQPPPYYLLGKRDAAVLDVMASAPTRLFALDDAGAEGVQGISDCTYLAVYAALAAQYRFALRAEQLSPAAIVLGLSALVGGKSSLAVSQVAAIIRTLETTRGTAGSVNLVGSSGDLDFAGLPTPEAAINGAAGLYLAPQPDEQALYCVDPQLHDYCASKVVFSASGAQLTRTASNCPCLP
jgi:hypothetical protein